jgi:23S rRNA (uracil1939-C5)-methyltransferase
MATSSKKIIPYVRIDSLAEGFQGVGRVDNQVVFVAGAAPGDVMDIEISKRKKGYALARPAKLHQPGESRVIPFCSHFGICGGCHWQHVTYEAQLAAKEQHVREKLIHLAHIPSPPVAPILRAQAVQYYRNKLEYTFSNRRWLTAEEIQQDGLLDHRGLGFHKALYFDKVVDLMHCYLQGEPSNTLRMAIAQFAKDKSISFYDLRTNQGFLRNLIVRTTTTGEVMVILQVGQGDSALIGQLMAFIKAQFPSLTSLQYVVNTKRNETFHDLPVCCYAGQAFITERMEGLQWRIGPKSFFQTNTQQAAVLYKKVVALAALRGDEVVYDLYTGVGTIAHFLAQRAQQVIGVEMIAEAIEDAQMNARLNQLKNAFFYAGDIKEVLQQLATTAPRPDLVVIDPPRAGIHPTVASQLLQLAPERIIYVSCNPATQARDISVLQAKYRLVVAQPIDMFPQTSHVENVALLVKSS